MKKIFKKAVSSLLIAAMLIGSLSFGCLAYADDLVAINATNFPDANFRAVISAAFDDNSDGFLNATERNRRIMSIGAYLEEVCGEGAKIRTISGIQFFPNLSKLYCAGIGLTSLDLSSNTSLTYVSAGGNELTSVNIGNQPNLTNLDVSLNDITALNLATCPNLVYLQCYANELSTLNVTMLSNLQLLYCYQNNITSLNLGANEQLVYLYCSNNKIWELDLSQNTNLAELTSVDIGNQWVSANAYLQNGQVCANRAFVRPANIVSTTVDKVEETEEGTATTLGFSNNRFFFDEIGQISKKLVDENNIRYDGIVYNYNVNNESCENMTVNVKLERSVYQVNYYLDSTKQERISYSIVPQGSSVTAPAVPDAPSCKEFVAWSATANNVSEDMDIYIIWKDTHVMHWYIDKEYNISMYCENCYDRTLTFNFYDAYNSKRGQGNYIEKADINNDGCINAKDFAIIIHM